MDGCTIHLWKKKGWLYKKGWYNTSWKKRYFVLYDDRTIHYFSKESHSSNRSKAKGKIHLTQIERVELVQYVDPKDKSSKSSSHYRSSTTNLSSNPSSLYRKSSLPTHLSQSSHSLTQMQQYIDLENDEKKKRRGRNNKHRQQQVQSHAHIPLSPNMFTTFSFSDHEQTINHTPNKPKKKSLTPRVENKNRKNSKNSKSKRKQSQTPKNDNNTFAFSDIQLQPRIQRASTIHLTSEYGTTPLNNSLTAPISKSYEDKGISPLQSIDEKESFEATSLSPYNMLSCIY